MAAYLIVDSNNTVINAIDYDGVSEFPFSPNTIVVPGIADVGWMWDPVNQVAINPNPVVEPVIATTPITVE